MGSIDDARPTSGLPRSRPVDLAGPATDPRLAELVDDAVVVLPGGTFNQPGGEWGTGFTFPRKGCWTVRVIRDGKSAETGGLVG